MPGVTFFCFFVQPETNRKGVVTPLGRTRVKELQMVFLTSTVINSNGNMMKELERKMKCEKS